MKKLIYRPGIMAAVLVLIFFFSLAVSMFAIGGYPIYFHQKPILLSWSQVLAARYLEDPESIVNQKIGSEERILIFDTEGNCLWHIAGENAFPDTDLGDSLLQYLPSTLSGNSIYRQKFSYQNNDIIIIAGIPIKDGATVVGTMFFIKDLKNLPEAMESFAICYAVLYWISAFFCIAYLRKKKRLEEVQQNYIANVTHSLKAPIAAVKAITETLSDVPDLDTDKRMVYYGVILRETNYQSHMVQEILELSKLQSHSRDFTKTRVNAAEALKEVFEKYSMLCSCAGISLHVPESIASLPPLYTNTSCIQQVMEILLENAVKYVIGGNDIWVDVTTTKSQAVFCVRDNGIGISKDDLPHVFERFYQCSRSNKGGSGLGLSIAQELISGLKEKIWVESELGKGAAFYFTVRMK